ncbi:D-alanyl-D-alanine carboxypeptidase/D-alanyl-D-alanine-endopeptidase [Hyphomonas sp.]|uniref:D-alanyl-D-alanine carboxypeptidase/D-alanyl-D-alanine endopeptidase n=1 Tax=Hyphomonas sp. TaxID=87 RepID=UPI001DF7E8DE|nr:D-alanyl-D-alanine carboxypeptidase/D-alanyl-D-alanine-endopeptidase [Hyphomonas sp.]MBU3919582.1 D-alanyl-D-alanine carboxypeptidase/D-alanyl-D-alanine-endopeptidase [Alphaproteobacteria bacterium]MBU4060717.1 D-alanyl-D-alanine carboxypeptidase/D-alanyl-D-alanine-endopeptidase [Alphaproteobacteria bacterium]MBU4164701.1 D-alanyl-D-alanine carboxypeptidase/D-alanyl-D-alanine-endopeptidase [Alphaproteobacteria bacterium]
MTRASVWQSALLGLALLLPACTTAPVDEPAVPVMAAPAEGVRLGVLVTTLDGAPVFAKRETERFIPASNTKMFTAAAMFHFVTGLQTPDPSIATSLHLVPGEGDAPPSLVLTGGGDPAVRDGADCVEDCLRQLADAVVARGIFQVGDIYADDTAFPHEPWGMGWSWNNLPFYFGASVSALTVNGNALALQVVPGSAEGEPIRAVWAADDDLLGISNAAVTGAPGSEQTLSLARWPGARDVRLSGSLPADAAPRNYFLSVDDPARSAAERLARLLTARSVTIEGVIKVRSRSDAPLMGTELSRLTPPPLLDSIAYSVKDSDNLFAELMLRHLARATGGEGAEDGLDAVNAMLDQAGISRAEVELFDGSGLSPYNRITPAAAVKFLRWTSAQPWGDAFRATLPVGGQDGSLARRFRNTPLDGRIFAKTGAVQGVNALSGFMVAASGETLVFSVIANDRPADAASVIPVIDSLLLQIAAAN